MSEHAINMTLLVISALSGAAELAIFWMILQDYRKTRGKPELKMPARRWVAMSLLSMGPLIAVFVLNRFIVNQAIVIDASGPIVEDNEENALEKFVGFAAHRGDGNCQLTANGNRFWPYREAYRIAFACFFWEGQSDPDDSTQVLISKAFDISRGNVQMLIQWNPSFEAAFQSAASNNAPCINYTLLMVPNGIDVQKATTIREAKSMGAKQVWHQSACGSLGIQTDSK
jgi:hypothetical protein